MSVRRSVARVSLLLAMLALGGEYAVGQTHSEALNTGWKFHALEAPGHKDAEQWMPAAVPSVVQMDLRRADGIPDPFFADNEQSLQWIGTTDWEYGNEFVADADPGGRWRRQLDLVPYPRRLSRRDRQSPLRLDVPHRAGAWAERPLAGTYGQHVP